MPPTRARPLRVSLLVAVIALLPGPAAVGAAERACSPAWTVTDTPDLDPANSPLTAVDARTSTDVWAVGYASAGAQSMHWNGTAWASEPMPAPAHTAGMVALDVASVGPSDVWAVGWRYAAGAGEGARAFIQRWNGEAWAAEAVTDLDGIYGQLYSIDAAAPDDIWAVGFTSGSAPGGDPQPLAMHYDGQAWHEVATPAISGPNAVLWDVRALAPDDVWAVGSRQPRPSRPIGDRTLIEHWDGTSWTVVPSPEVDDQVHYLTTVDGSGPDDVWAAGSIGGFRTLLQHWDGTSWSVVGTGLDEDIFDAITDLEAVSDHDVWGIVSISREHSQTVHFDGVSWSMVPVPPASARALMDLDATPRGDLWAVGNVLGDGRHASLAERLCPSRPSSDGFAPDVVTTPYGSGLAWSVPARDDRAYRLVDATGLELFDSGILTATDTFTQRFAVAGTYVVSESIYGTSQTIRLRPAAQLRPRLGAGTMKVTWAFGDVPGDLVVHVQVRRPGTRVWETWKGGSEDQSAFFVADAGVGRYAFRARLRDPASGAASGWSPPAHVTVE